MEAIGGNEMFIQVQFVYFSIVILDINNVLQLSHSC